jgi:hypothetical protein
MDISKLSHGVKIVLGGSIAFLVASFFNWQQVEFAGIASVGVSMWHGVGVIAGLLAIAIIVWEGLRLANMKIEIGLTPSMVTAALAVLLVFFTVLKFLIDNEFRTFWAWLGLALSIAIVVGAWLNMQDTGESISDLKNSMAAAASGAAAAARSVGGPGQDAAPAQEVPAAPTPPAAPEPPVSAEPPAAPAAPASEPAAASDEPQQTA